MNNSIRDISFLSKYGYLIKRELISQNDIFEITQVLEDYCKFYKKDYFNDLNWSDCLFQEKIVSLRNNEKKITSKIYDALQSNAILCSILSKKSIIEFVAELMKVKGSSLTMTGAMIRMDYPQDERNRLDWHIEQSYYAFNGRGRDGLVVWIPLMDVDNNNGTIMIKAGSHITDIDFKNLKPVIQPGIPGISEQYNISSYVLDQYETVNVEVKSGDGVLFYMNTLHASGYNISKSVRIAIGVRYHNSFSDKYNVVRLVPTTINHS